LIYETLSAIEHSYSTFAGVFGFRFFSEYSWTDSVYMTIITISTVGFKKLKLAGADNVILSDKTGGEHMANPVVKLGLVEFLDNL